MAKAFIEAYLINEKEGNMRKRSFICFFITLVFWASYAQAELQPIAEIMVLKREPVTLRQLKLQIGNLEKAYGRKLTVDERMQVLDGMINEKLVRQAAEKNGIKVMDSQVNEYFNKMLSQQVGVPITEAEFSKLIKAETNQSLDEFMKSQTGMTVAESKEFLRGQLAIQMYVMQKKGNEIQTVHGPADEQIRAQYDMNKKDFVRPDTVKLFIVIVPKNNKTAEEKSKIESLNKKLKANPKLINEVKQTSGKDSGYIAESFYAAKTPLAAQQLGIKMEALMEIFLQPVNFVSDVTDMPTNYQFFVVQEKLDMKFLGLSDVIDPNQTVTVYEFIRENLKAEMQNALLQKSISELTTDLRKAVNFKMLKSEAELKKLLIW